MQRSTLEDPEQHLKYLHCFQRSSTKAPTCLFRCGTFETLILHSVPREQELWESLGTLCAD